MPYAQEHKQSWEGKWKRSWGVYTANSYNVGDVKMNNSVGKEEIPDNYAFPSNR